MHNGATSIGYDGLTYSGGPDSGENEAVLLNPDGFSRWFNRPEFDGSGLPILEYWPGKLSNLHDPTATLNAYKVFADGLGLNDYYYTWITSPGNAEDRGVFRAGGVNSRRYQLDFPIIGGVPRVDFQYAVIAGWESGNPTLTGNPSVYDPFDFPTSANCEEAFLVDISTGESDLYNDGQGESGGDFRADIEVFDWQGGSVGGLGVPEEVWRIIIEGDFIPGGSYEFAQAELETLAVPGTENSSVFQVEIIDCTPKESDEASLWVIVESAGLNGGSYNQGYPTEYPESARRAAFMPGTVAVGGESPQHVIYVDDSNTTGTEDGSKTYPYNTVQEGVDAASVLEGYEVWVDDSGNPYLEQVDILSGTVLRSVNWDESDGSNRAFIDGPEDPETYSVHFENVNGALLDGFRIGFAGPWTLEWPYNESTQMVGIEGGSDVTVQDCLFTGETNLKTVYPVVANGATDVVVANCRMADIDRGASDNGCVYFRGVYALNSPGLVVRNNVMTNVRSTEDETQKGIEMVYVTGSMDIAMKNNLIHHVVPHAGVGSMGAILMEGFHFESCPGVEVANNTVDYMDSSDAFSINQCFGYTFEDCSDVAFTDSIVTRIYSSGFPPPLARAVQAFDCTVVCDFTDVWDVQASYYGGAVQGTGCISANPIYIDPDNEDYDISPTSPAQAGDPSFLDWDDDGSGGSESRSRMGCHGGPGGEVVGLLTAA
jgi:hypothetical protein